MRFHVLGLFHTITSKEMLSCAFTQKVVKFIEMMQCKPEEIEIKKRMTTYDFINHKTIHYMIHYGHEKSEVNVDEHVTVVSDQVWKKCYGDYDWKKDFFKHSQNDITHKVFNDNTIIEMKRRVYPGDIVLCFWGLGHIEIMQAFKDVCICVEPGIGYPPASSCNAEYKVFESYAIMHNYYGIVKTIHPPWHDCVIPNYFNPDDFEFKERKENYILFLSRIVVHKGLGIVIELAKIMGFRLLIAGQGSLEKDLGVKDLPCNIEYVGFADLQKRKKLMANAKALILPTLYAEPFGGVTMEAMLSGTPVITCDWGVFTETVIHGVTGFRCRTLEQYMWAIDNIHEILPKNCRDWAMNYCLEKIRPMYEEFFDMLLKKKFANGFNNDNLNRTELSWLEKTYPTSNEKHSPRSIRKKYRILLYTETKWAFGRIASALIKYSKKFNIDVLEWTINHNSEIFNKYDLIYLTTWDCARKFELQHPKLRNRIVFSFHGLVDLVKMKFDDESNNRITNQDVDKFNYDKRIIDWIKQRKLPISVVSHQLQEKFPELNIMLTQCGADPDIFYPIPCANDKLMVLFPYSGTNNMGYGYDAKRHNLLTQLINDVDSESIEFIYLERPVSSEKMLQLYQKCDVFLCISHSEGSPLGAFEAGACGKVVISTKVGEMPYFIKEGENGFLIENNDKTIVKNILDKLEYLYANPKILKAMKANMLNIMKDWYWDQKIDQWDKFFEKSLNLVKSK